MIDTTIRKGNRAPVDKNGYADVDIHALGRKIVSEHKEAFAILAEAERVEDESRHAVAAD